MGKERRQARAQTQPVHEWGVCCGELHQLREHVNTVLRNCAGGTLTAHAVQMLWRQPPGVSGSLLRTQNQHAAQQPTLAKWVWCACWLLAQTVAPPAN